MGNIYTVGPNEALIVSGRRNFTLFSNTPFDGMCTHESCKCLCTTYLSTGCNSLRKLKLRPRYVSRQLFLVHVVGSINLFTS